MPPGKGQDATITSRRPPPNATRRPPQRAQDDTGAGLAARSAGQKKYTWRRRVLARRNICKR
eukprot:15431591-Alexandrium_andersonii.AAC.1